MGADVLVTVHHERGRGHVAEVRAIEGDEFLPKVRDIRAAVSDAGEDDARLDARLGLVPRGPVARVRVAGAQEHGGGPPARRVARDRHPPLVEAAPEPRHGRLDAVELVEDPHHVRGSLLPEQLLALGRLEPQERRAQVRRLQHREAVRGPELVQGRVPLQRRERVAAPLAVREEDDRQGVPGRGHRYAQLEVDGTAGGGEDDGAEGDDGFGGVGGDVGRGADEGVVTGMHGVCFCLVIWIEWEVEGQGMIELVRDGTVKREVFNL